MDLTIKSFLEGVCSILAARRKRKEENRVTSINDIIRNKIGMEDLDDNLKKIAINKTQERKNEIINPKKCKKYIYQILIPRNFELMYKKPLIRLKNL
ncbi:hypothetical protein [Rickettsia asembonensis]|uniref:hypothetical protein n=1 Tax=Rickettsia asembonensis TaxID=1068590 RepID=UPI000A8EE0ED|nr:hypothetical protein [Rickettsia asembonensis]